MKYNSIDEYIATCDEDVKGILQQIRSTIQLASPNAVECISYNIPTFKLNGKSLLHFAAFKYHIGLFATPSGHIKFEKEFAKYKSGKGSVQFPLSKEMPFGLITKVVGFRTKEIMQSQTIRVLKSHRF